jgi:hypothetical protein
VKTRRPTDLLGVIEGEPFYWGEKSSPLSLQIKYTTLTDCDERFQYDD